MSNGNYVKFFLNLVVRNIIVIFFVGLLCSGALVAEKYYFNNYLIQSGDWVASCIVKIDDKAHRNEYHEIDYAGLVRSPNNIRYLIEKSESAGEIEFNKLDANWKHYSARERRAWIQKNTWLNNYHGNIFEFGIRLDSSIAKDMDYVNNKGTTILNSFVENCMGFIKSVRPETSFTVVNIVEESPKRILVSKRKILMKYAIIGFVLGCLLACSIIFVKNVVKAK